MRKPFRVSDRLKSFKYAWKGLIYLIRNEHSAWIHGAAIITVTIAGFYFNISKGEWIAVILCFGMVLAAEAFNTAIEKIVNLISPGRSPVAGNVKDLAAAAVFVCAIAAAIVGLMIFVPYLVN